MESVFCEPRRVDDVDSCEFYHVMDNPEGGVWGGKWDLRANLDAYLGHTEFSGRKVLDVGTASGFLCFEMEKRGADVTAYDIAPDGEWDIVPFAQHDYKGNSKEFRAYVERFKNAFWYAHARVQSRAQCVYGSVYDMPEAMGRFDMAVYGCILLHLRDPFRALENGLRLVKDTVIVTDLVPTKLFDAEGNISDVPYMEFLPDFKTLKNKEAWWLLSPKIIQQFIGVLGFGESEVVYHTQYLNGLEMKLFTVVGKRTSGQPV
ncbi:class I SAM-dependent methyltransferase [Desulfovibrio subterraneus]|uniref:class I SAM-dependent methyltransferase n=1 Tax=Desulfovibrio subterraneus TaxID=2718620 RepID=UPI0022B895F2|nr:methyltransferase domain-containing protein [Desulfovibrio subterraneus]WBF66827.1 class I SAM-dependent methyltransferase [Desulfovibrio subterraneus]